MCVRGHAANPYVKYTTSSSSLLTRREDDADVLAPHLQRLHHTCYGKTLFLCNFFQRQGIDQRSIPLPISCREEHQCHPIHWNARGRTMLPCYHAKTRNVFSCISIDSHLQWTTPVVVASALSDSKYTRMPLAHPLPFIMWTTRFYAYCLVQMMNERA